MTLELSILGIFVGILSGFFGIGGGTVSVPILLYLGFDIKSAIGISVMQMVFGSLVAGLIHKKKQTYDTGDIIFFGYGGIIGAIIGGYLVKILDATILGWLFLTLVVFTLIRLMTSNPTPSKEEFVSRPVYSGVGAFIGVFSGMLGVGGSILMTPILVSFMGFELKKASAIGLFFVMFTSLSALVTLLLLGLVDIRSALVMSVASIGGIFMGIALLNRVKISHYKQILVVFYILIFIITAKKIVLG